jgi:hypothetical protein
VNGVLGNPVVDLGAVTVGTIIVALTVQRWWKTSGGGGGPKGPGGPGGGGGRSWKALAPFFMSVSYGLVVILASPGISVLGTVSKLGLWGGNELGHAYLVWGIGGSDPNVSRVNPVVLTPGGYAILGIWTALVIGQHVWSRRLPRIQTSLGVAAGILLGLSAGIAGVAAIPLASGVNVLGAWYTGVV